MFLEHMHRATLPLALVGTARLACAAAALPHTRMQAQADSGCGHELWPDMTGVFARKACTALGGAYLRDNKQAMVGVGDGC